MKSNLITALIIVAVIVLIGNIFNIGLSTVAVANVGITGGTYSLAPQVIVLYCLSGILFVLSVELTILSITIERKKNK